MKFKVFILRFGLTVGFIIILQNILKIITEIFFPVNFDISSVLIKVAIILIVGYFEWLFWNQEKKWNSKQLKVNHAPSRGGE